MLQSLSRYWCALVVLGLLANVASAGQLVNMYRADILVKTQSETERNAAARSIFGQVIVRVSGQRSALENPAVLQAINNAPNYLFGFSYQSTRQRITEDGKTFPAVNLQLNYSPQAIDQLLRQSQLPLWPAQRPKVLIWVVAQDQTGLHLVPEPSSLAALQAQATYRGLPILTPNMDLEDSLALSAEDVWQLQLVKIKDASQRYKADAILVGRYTPYAMGPIPRAIDPNQLDATIGESSPVTDATNSTPLADVTSQATGDATALEQPQGPWIGEWQLIQADNVEVFFDETPEAAGLFESAIDRAADYFAGQYAIVPTNQGPQTIVLNVNNITDFGSFKQVQRYLNDLAMVSRIEVLRVNGDGLLVALTTEGDVRLLMSTLSLGKKLMPIESESISSLETSIAQPNPDPAINANAPINASAPMDIDAESDLQAALAAEQGSDLSTAASDLPVSLAVPAHAGTNEDPLLYVWQAK